MFAFGSNRNFSLGFGDDEDRQFPERVHFKRPDHLLQRFYNEYLESAGLEGTASTDLSKIPTLVLERPLVIRDVVLSKLHSAVVTNDPVSNLYICGVGRGGRLGLGDENTRFTYTAIQGPLTDKRITAVALGRDHSLALTDDGALYSWGNNAMGQLGYTLPTPAKKDEDPISTVPQRVFSALKKECILGIAASSIHSVAHTGSSLYCWGKNAGQLALMDADSRSLEYQHTPRKVAASLFSSPIVQVTAIDKATTVLLQNHTVCVFTGYGYHIVKFPFASLYSVGDISMSTRYEAGRNQIYSITSGGETIAALTGRGDLYTMHLDHKIETNPSATSTTNPSKIKGAVTQPQCIWNARKDGVASVGVADHGSVIISTKSGAVWRRMKRAKAKDTYTGSSETKRNDFKFQRVPYITKVAAVRASPFGAFAAITQDADVMKEQLNIRETTLWEDVKPLNCLKGFVQAQDPPIPHHVLESADFEENLRQYLVNWEHKNTAPDATVCSSSASELIIPVHSWLLSARSSVLRVAITRLRKTGVDVQHDGFSISKQEGKLLISFQGLDPITLLNLVMYLYEDRLVAAWNYTRQSPAMAYRYRQIRLEVMRLAVMLNMVKLEKAARLQVPPEKCLDDDLKQAIEDPEFFKDGDTSLQLDGGEVIVHSTFICQRCPWFSGLYHGRSRGIWLTGRRGDSAYGSRNRTKIDLKHMEPRAFQYVLRHLYGDYGADLFDPAVCDSFDDFVDLVMEVLSIANYLMLDRLSQICQQVMGKFAHTRNIAYLLNEISPCAVTEFKDAGLEYICLQLESMLENHLLDDLDEDLLLELDQVVRDNQTAQLPFVKSGRTELLLHENYPELAQDIDEERQIRVKEMAFKASRDDDRKLSTSVKGKGTASTGLDDVMPMTPTPDKSRRVSKGINRNAPLSPELKSKASQADLMFDMDEDESTAIHSPLTKSQNPPELSAAEMEQIPFLKGRSWRDSKGKAPITSEHSPLGSSPATPRGLPLGSTPKKMPAAESATPTTPAAKAASPWAKANVSLTPKLDLSDIIQSEQSSAKRPSVSALSEGLASAAAATAQRKGKEATPLKTTPQQPKISQKERKRQQQEQAAAEAALLAAANARASKAAWDSSDPHNVPAWKVVTPALKGKTPPSGTMGTHPPVASGPKMLAPTESVQPVSRRTASPDTRFAGQRSNGASASSSTPRSSRPIPARPGAQPSTSSGGGSLPKQTPPPHGPQGHQQQPEAASKPLVPHSKVYLTPAPKAEQLVGFTMEDIIVQQQLEQERMKGAVAKRSLQEIQEEQAFQEWWEAESKRTQEEERRREEKEKQREERKKSIQGGGGGGSGGKRGKNTGKGFGGKSGTGNNAAGSGGTRSGAHGNEDARRGEGGGGGGSAAAGGPGKGKGRGKGGGGGGGRGRGGGREATPVAPAVADTSGARR